ncbi:MAG: tol-pal system protein YbgF [Thermodesulfobacteriota bacterium]
MDHGRFNSAPISAVLRLALLAAGLTLFVLTSGCGDLVSLKGNKDFQNLENQVREHQGRTDQELAGLRQDVTELQVATGLRPPTSGAGVPYTGKMTSSRQVQAEYNRGRTLFLKGDYEAAAQVFTGILTRSPGDKLAPNAGYWLGECHYSRGRYKEAIGYFDQVARTYPKSHKAPDSMLKIAYSYHRLGDGPSAMTTLRDLLSKYPDSRAAGMIKSGRTIFRDGT